MMWRKLKEMRLGSKPWSYKSLKELEHSTFFLEESCDCVHNGALQGECNSRARVSHMWDTWLKIDGSLCWRRKFNFQFSFFGWEPFFQFGSIFARFSYDENCNCNSLLLTEISNSVLNTIKYCWISHRRLHPWKILFSLNDLNWTCSYSNWAWRCFSIVLWKLSFHSTSLPFWIFHKLLLCWNFLQSFDK